MNQRANRVRLPCQDPTLEIEVTDDGSRTLINKATGDSYHSSSGAISETRQVYLRNSGVQERLSSGQATRVLEIGLGTGMGMFLTVDHAIKHGTPLDYVALEYHWLSADVVRELAPESWVDNTAVVADYIRWRSSVPESQLPCGQLPNSESAEPKLTSEFRWHAGEHQVVQIQLVDALRWRHEGESFDAIYFDPFAPDTNAELWQTPMLAVMYKLLNMDGRFVTYCVKREVRDRLKAVGFDVRKIRGPEGGKREVLVATRH
ncbi:tRNA (5-methylaminomethyl-2-thiouridine)(34)-methyltransferase MnmD [Novipirellula rosea]|uniref:tRNA (5-methylaminomethyl-2-thiouridine)(34)-methyltransferase MnmD n=1 Tax=Novipirellula rosea TaxID=1031540 RepID=A0ABP8ML78_9BACT